MLQIKNILCDILDYAYPESEKLGQYKKFYVEISEKNMKSFHGDYNPKNHHIRIFNLYRSDAAVIATTIHELTHHVDHVNRGKSDHSAEFYRIFKHLLYTALDMSLFTKEDFLDAMADASDSRKIAGMITDYEPSDIGYKKSYKRLIVNNGYEHKDFLKSQGFSYNKINHVWELEAEEDVIYRMARTLSNKRINCEVVKAGTMSFNKSLFLVATKGTYEVRDQLKAEGFTFDKKKKAWKKQVEQNQAQEILKQISHNISNVTFKIM